MHLEPWAESGGYRTQHYIKCGPSQTPRSSNWRLKPHAVSSLFIHATVLALKEKWKLRTLTPLTLKSLNCSHRTTKFCNLYYSQNKKILFPQRPVIAFIRNTEVVFSVR